MEKRINGHTRLYALIGSPVGHSGSPAMQNYSFEKLGIDAAYLAFDVNVGQTRQHLIWELMTVLQHLRQQATYLSVTLKRRLNKKMRKIGAKYFAPIFLQQNGIKKTL